MKWMTIEEIKNEIAEQEIINFYKSIILSLGGSIIIFIILYIRYIM